MGTAKWQAMQVSRHLRKMLVEGSTPKPRNPLRSELAAHPLDAYRAGTAYRCFCSFSCSASRGSAPRIFATLACTIKSSCISCLAFR